MPVGDFQFSSVGHAQSETGERGVLLLRSNFEQMMLGYNGILMLAENVLEVAEMLQSTLGPASSTPVP